MRLAGDGVRRGLRAGGERRAGGEEAAGAGAQAGEAERAAAQPGGQCGSRPAPAAAAAAAALRATASRGLQPAHPAQGPGQHDLLGPGGAGPRVPGHLLLAQPRALPALQPAARRRALRLLQAGGGLLRRGWQPGTRDRGDPSGGSPHAALAASNAVGRGGAAGPGELGRLERGGRLHLVLTAAPRSPRPRVLRPRTRGGAWEEGDPAA